MEHAVSRTAVLRLQQLPARQHSRLARTDDYKSAAVTGTADVARAAADVARAAAASTAIPHQLQLPVKPVVQASSTGRSHNRSSHGTANPFELSSCRQCRSINITDWRGRLVAVAVTGRADP